MRFFNTGLIFTVLLNFVYTDRILVLIDNPSIRNTHSIFLKSLENRNHKVVVSMADDSNLSLMQFGESNYEHLIIFAPSVEGFFFL